MGSPLGCAFANFYMASVEIKSLNEINEKPILYACYVDDILLVVNSVEQMHAIQTKFMENSVLNFTHEEGDNKLAFLDVQIEIENNELKTSVYVKVANTGGLLNFKSECPDNYKKGVITNMLHRGFKILSNMQLFQQEIRRIKHFFSNNNYPMKVVDQCIKSFLQSKTRQNPRDDKAQIVVYYQNQMHRNY